MPALEILQFNLLPATARNEELKGTEALFRLLNLACALKLHLCHCTSL